MAQAVVNNPSLVQDEKADNKKRQLALGRALAWVLRHGANAYKKQLLLNSAGYVNVTCLTNVAKTVKKLQAVATMTLDELKTLVATDNKNRYTLLAVAGNANSVDEKVDYTYYVRANQGHSFPVPDLELCQLDEKQVPYVVHGTTTEALEKVNASGFLSRMSRQHMHFTQEKDFAKLGRNHSSVVLRVDVAQAVQDGYRFYVASNGVVLSDGKDGDGKLPCKYFKVVSQ